MLAVVTTYYGAQITENFSPTARARRAKVLNVHTLPAKHPPKSGPRLSRKADAEVFSLVTDKADEVISFEDQQEIDRQYAALDIYQGGKVDSSQLQQLRMQQEPYVLTALHAHFRFAGDELDRLARSMRAERSIAFQAFDQNLSIFRMEDGQQFAVISAQSIQEMIDPLIWIPELEQKTENVTLALGLKWASDNFEISPGQKFTESTYRLFRLLQHLKQRS